MSEYVMTDRYKHRVNDIKSMASEQVRQRTELEAELAAIQEELERRVSLAKSRKGKPPWKSSS